MIDSLRRRAMTAAAATALAVAVLAPAASAAAKNANFVGTWKLSNNQPFTIKTENRKTGACSGTTSLAKGGAYRLVGCHVTGNHFRFTITYGSGYRSFNSGTITGNHISAHWHDTGGSSGVYTGVRGH